MNKIFIDANIYLRFFDSKSNEFKKLLATLTELGNKIIVTQQIADEVNRNKLKVFQLSVETLLKQKEFSKISLPEHLNDKENLVRDWNSKRKLLETDAGELNKKLVDIVEHVAETISLSTDVVSETLQKIFAYAEQTTEELHVQAVKRWEVGNPPGKDTDPAGDQINWLILLEQCKELTKLWLVTNDRDYFTDFGKKKLLNASLSHEIRQMNPKLEVSIFDSLSEALRDYNEAEQIKSLPGEKELNVIIQDEPELNLHPPFYGGGYSIPTQCPKCGEKDSFNNGAYLRSQYGGLTLQYVCLKCGYHYDTGDFWD